MASQLSSQIVIGALQLTITTFIFIITIFAWLGARRFQLHVVQGNDGERPLRDLQPATIARAPTQQSSDVN
ncbi:hypothetical protein F4679DRAFT_521709 [Xylaria curta]|nr:hypothetical protein F4679DRAFT_521709 [Xylaria curta]